MAQIRQEINIIDAILTSSDGAGTDQGARIYFDPALYSGSIAIYFEVVGKNASNQGQATLNNGTTTYGTLNPNTTTYTRYRTADISSSLNSAQELRLTIFGGAGVTLTSISSARLIVIQTSTPITSTETQIEVGNNETGKTNTAAAALTNPKYWLYTAAKWDGTKTFYAECTYAMSTTKVSGTITLQEDNGSFASWANIVTIVSTGTASTPTRVRSAAFVPTDGRHYRIATLNSSSKSTLSIYNAKVIVDQMGGAIATQESQTVGTSAFGQLRGDGGLFEQFGQSFIASATYLLTSMTASMSKVSSPTDNVYVKITSSLGGTAIATSDNVLGSGISSSQSNVTFTFTGTGRGILTSGETYYIEINRSGANDATNRYLIYTSSTSQITGGRYVKSNGVWGGESADTDLVFTITGSPSPFPTLLEAQYLLLNTSDGGTGLQPYQTLFDADEWSGVTNAYTHAHDASNAADSTKLTRESSTPGTFDTDITSSTVTGANQQISAALTLTDDKQIDSNVVTSTGVVAASRILVAVSVDAAVAGTFNSWRSLSGVGL